MYLLITLPDGPEVVDVQFRLHVLLAVVGDERDLKRVVPHEIEGLSDLGDCRWRFGECPSGGSSPSSASWLLGETQWLEYSVVGRRVVGKCFKSSN